MRDLCPWPHPGKSAFQLTADLFSAGWVCSLPRERASFIHLPEPPTTMAAARPEVLTTQGWSRIIVPRAIGVVVRTGLGGMLPRSFDARKVPNAFV